MTITNGFVQVNDASLYYETAGEGSPLVFVHGFGLDTRMWDSQFSFFAGQYKVVRYDMRGFGRSSLPGQAVYSHYDDLAALLDHLSIDTTHVVGLSAGGRAAIEFAIRYNDRVRSLVLADSGLNGYVNKQVLFEGIMAAAPRVGAAAANNMWLHHALFGPALEQTEVAAQLATMVGSYSGWHWMNANPQQVIQPPAIEQLFRIVAPTLVIIGSRDLPDYQAAADILADRIPNARKAVIPNAGHMSNMEAPQEFNRLVAEFLWMAQ